MTAWTDERIEQLKTLNDGRTASLIAKEIGAASRSAVIGKLRRLKIPLLGANSRRQRQGGRPRKRRLAHRKPIAVEAPQQPIVAADPIAPGAHWQPLPNTTPVSFESLTANQCRWPIGERAPYVFCGCAKVAGLSYCESHAAASTTARFTGFFRTNVPGPAAVDRVQEFLKEPAQSGAHPSTVLYWRSTRSLPNWRSTRSLPKLRLYDWSRAAELHDAGCNDREIARQIGCVPNTVACWRYRTGREAIHKPKHARGSLKAAVADLRSKNLSAAQIAAQLGVSAGYVRETFQRLDQPGRSARYSKAARHNELIGRT